MAEHHDSRQYKIKNASNSHMFTGEIFAKGKDFHKDFHKNLNIMTRKTFTNIFGASRLIIYDEAVYNISTIEDGLNEKTEPQK